MRVNKFQMLIKSTNHRLHVNEDGLKSVFTHFKLSRRASPETDTSNPHQSMETTAMASLHSPPLSMLVQVIGRLDASVLTWLCNNSSVNMVPQT